MHKDNHTEIKDNWHNPMNFSRNIPVEDYEKHYYDNNSKIRSWKYLIIPIILVALLMTVITGALLSIILL
jgi:hypothetical protein